MILSVLLACSMGSVGGVPALSDLVDLSSPPEKVATGFQFTEGPLWLKKGGLIFSDIPANKIFKWSPGAEAVVFRDPSGNSNGLTRDSKGRIIACEHGNRRVSRTDANGKVIAIAERYQGHRLNSPNDAVVKSDGSIYFTDPPYGVAQEDREMDFQGVYRLSASGELTLLAKDMDRPNGLAFSPDEKILYVADSSKKRLIMAYNVKPDGTLANGRVFAELRAEKPGVPDGLKVDKKGNIYSSGPGGIWVFTPSGVHVGTVDLPEVPTNCAWGDGDCRSLYITAQKSVYRIRCRVGGLGDWNRR